MNEPQEERKGCKCGCGGNNHYCDTHHCGELCKEFNSSPHNRPGDGREEWEDRLLKFLSESTNRLSFTGQKSGIDLNKLGNFIAQERLIALTAYRDAILEHKTGRYMPRMTMLVKVDDIERVSGEFGL